MLVASHCRTLRGRPWVLGVLLAGCLLWASIGVLSGEVAASSRGASVAPAVTLTQRGPILIQRNQDFTTANGGTGGSGTAAKPYTNSGWQSVDSKVKQLFIDNTTA